MVNIINKFKHQYKYLSYFIKLIIKQIKINANVGINSDALPKILDKRI